MYELPCKLSVQLTPMSEVIKHDANRRRFLKTAAAAGAATGVVAATTNALFPTLMPEKQVFETNQSYWSSALPPACSALQKDIDASVVIIGGGLTGLSAAYYLKNTNPSDRVVVVEAMRCGNGASGRNGAMLLTSTEDRYMVWSGDQALDKRIYDLTVDNAQRLAQLSSGLNFDVELELNGALQMCNTNELADEVRPSVEKFRNTGIPYEFWDRQRIVDTVGTWAYPGAVFDPQSGQVHPGKLVGLFKAAAESAHVEIYEASPVTSVDEGEILTIVTANGRRIRTRSLILATNAYSSKLGYLRGATTPVFDYMGMTAPLSESRLSKIGWKKRIPFNDSRTEVFYLGLTKDNRIHIGGGPVDYIFNNGLHQPSNTAKRFVGLSEELGRLFPSLANEPFECTWSGAVDMSLDQTPSVGQIGKYGNIFYAVGFSGHGVNLTSVFGRILADLAHGESKEWAWLPYLNRLPLYTPNEPFRWLGVQAALAYYRHTDPKVP